ncbi:MAG TPA: branched-chain amino acid ABC transporter permease [Usitatibacter sp.]|jgi:branched-chain amino acid transport system permease protein|nr:branched-chain amino acid ABC transporter permease [Usitatibacter sp.]
MKTPNRAVLALFAVASLAAVPLAVPGYPTTLATEMLIFATLAMSIDILAGFAGRTPLCHGAIFGVSTYVVLYYVTVENGNPWIGVALGVAAATLTAMVFALLAVRTSGVYFLLLTLALGMIVWGVCLRWTSVTGGENGIRGSVRPAWLAGQARLYYFVLAATSVMTLAMWRFVRSPFGLTLAGIRENETRMRALGYGVPLHLFLGFAVSGFFAGLAGALYAFFNSFVSPSTVGLAQSVEGLLMAIVGGVGTLFGGLVGSVIIIALESLVSAYTERWMMALGLLFIFTMIFAPSGLLGRVRELVGKRRT